MSTKNFTETQIINEYFKNESNNIEKLNNDLNDLFQEFDSIVEENNGDEEIFNDEEKVNEKLIKDKIKEESDENITILNKLLTNLSSQKEIKKNIKIHQEALNKLIIDKYNSFDENSSKYLIITKKWFKLIERTFGDKYEDLVYDLSNKIINEYENYEETLSQLSKKTSDLESIVLKDLEGMGFKC